MDDRFQVQIMEQLARSKGWVKGEPLKVHRVGRKRIKLSATYKGVNPRTLRFEAELIGEIVSWSINGLNDSWGA